MNGLGYPEMKYAIIKQTWKGKENPGKKMDIERYKTANILTQPVVISNPPKPIKKLKINQRYAE